MYAGRKYAAYTIGGASLGFMAVVLTTMFGMAGSFRYGGSINASYDAGMMQLAFVMVFHVGNAKVFHLANWSLADSSNFSGFLYHTYLKVLASLSITIASACSQSMVKLSNSQIDCSTTKSCKFLLSSSSKPNASSLAFSATFSWAENVFFPQAFNKDSS